MIFILGTLFFAVAFAVACTIVSLVQDIRTLEKLLGRK